MAFRDKLIAACTTKAQELNRKLRSLEIVDCAAALHEDSMRERRKAAIVPEAEQIYQAYPLKVGKEDALRAISGALKKREFSYLMAKTTQFGECVSSWPSSYRYTNEGRDLVPHAASWFNAGRYEDAPEAWKRFGARKAANSYIPPQEPSNWRSAFPDFTDKDKQWSQLQPSQHQFIIAAMTAASSASETPNLIDSEQRLRNA